MIMTTQRMQKRLACLPARLSGRRGQALLVAVLLMTVILLVGILFAAVVSYNQEQSARHLDLVAAQLQAEAGINYASRMLESSPQGADWRPRLVAHAGGVAEDPTDPTTWPKDPSLWPNPPAMYQGAPDEYDYNFWGPDGVEGTDDDYYSDFDVVRGYFPLRAGTRQTPGEFVRMGFFRFPDPNQVAPSAAAMDSLTLGRGYFLLQVTYDPDPPYEPGDATRPDPLSGNTHIVCIGRAVEESNVFRRLEAYKPLGLTDHMRWITNKQGDPQQAVLGVRPELDLNFSGAGEPGEELVTEIDGPVRSETALYWVGKTVNIGGTVGPSCFFNLESAPVAGEGYLRYDLLLAPRGLYTFDPGGTGGAEAAGNLLPDSISPADRGPNRVYVGSQTVPALVPVDIDTPDPVSGVSRYLALTRDSGEMVRATDADDSNGITVGDPVNTGLYGRGAGIYVDNRDDIQFRQADGKSDLERLANDWLKSPQGSLGSETSWNAALTTYSPPGVQIEFFPTEEATLAGSTGMVSSDEPPAATGVLWWPGHVAGAPGIKITRQDKRWRRADFTAGTWHVAEDSGRNTIVLDYPAFPNQVLYAAGNVRVKGTLPATGRAVANGPLDRSFDVTVVSGGTVYIDGQLMTAQDVYGRKVDINDANPGVLDEDTAKIALLAKDYVCLNPTQLVPQLTTGLVTAAADDETNPTLEDQHWELYPDTGGAAWTQWRFGWPTQVYDAAGDTWNAGTPGQAVAVGDQPDEVRVMLTPIHAGADPGPSGMGMNIYRELSPNPETNPYTFGAPAPLDPWTFMFVPPGSLLGSVPSPQPYASNAIAPNWQAPGSTPAWEFTNPSVPFLVSNWITATLGSTNAITMFHRDPQIGAGSTAYLLKKWKIEELRPDESGNRPFEIPQPAVHAKINALMYAERGSWFVIPGQYFDPKATTLPTYDVEDGGDPATVSGLDSLYAARFARYNYDITVRGTITEEHTASLEAAQTWTERWAYPLYTGSYPNLSLAWGTIRYEFDERLRMNREQSLTTLVGATRSAGAMVTTAESSLPKLPCLPSSPTLIYAGGTF